MEIGAKMENYEIGLIFVDDKDYTNKAKWCNENGCYIEEIEPLEDGTRQFQIKAPKEPTQEELKNEKHAQLKQIMHNKRLNLKVNYDNDTFDANEEAQANMIVLLKAFDLGAQTVSIRSSTEETHVFDKEHCQELSLIMLSAVQAIYDQYWDLKDLLSNCETVEEVEAISWNENEE